METKGKEKFFIVTRGKARKGFSRGCIGRVEAELQPGELKGLLYGSGSNAGSPKSGGVVRTEDTYPLTRHQAQLLLFVSPSSKRLELLCNPQLFSAICELSRDDLVVVKHKKGHMPGLVKNLMQIGRKENQEDLQMLGFEVEFVEESAPTSSKKPVPLPLFNAADIIQVVPAYSVPLGFHGRDGHSGGLNRKPVSRINSMPSIGSRARQMRENPDVQSISESPNGSHIHLDVGSMVEVISNTGVTVYGVIRWMGVLPGKTTETAGIELDYDINGCSDGIHGGQRYFSCKGNRALFMPVTKCSPDSRFLRPPTYKESLQPQESREPSPARTYDLEEDAPPIPESEALSLLVGRMKGIQGHFNSCYLDATLFSLFSSATTLDTVCSTRRATEQPISCTLRKDIINRLRRQGFVPAASVMKFRKQLGCETFLTEEKDPEEFITVLLQKGLCMEPLLKLRSKGGVSQGAYTFQIILEKEQVVQKMPTVQQLLDTSFLSCDLKFEEIPSCLILQMPRFGKKYKMFPNIIPSTELDITDLLYNSPRECFICGCVAEMECPQCLPDCKLQPGKIKQYCSTCNTQVHSHRLRQGHGPRVLAVPPQMHTDNSVPRHMMQLFAVLCIKTSHYVSFVKYGADTRSWLFFDSMADRCGDDERGYNIPEIKACPEVGDFLSQTDEELARANLSQADDLVCRLLCDSYMFLYQSPSMQIDK